MFVCSGVNIRFLTVTERGRKYTPFRWVRYITHRCGMHACISFTYG